MLLKWYQIVFLVRKRLFGTYFHLAMFSLMHYPLIEGCMRTQDCADYLVGTSSHSFAS